MTTLSMNVSQLAGESAEEFLAHMRVLAKEEHVSLPKYLAAMLHHALKGHYLSKIHFYQDGSGQTYDLDEVRETHEQAMAESAAGLSYRCETKEEALALLDKWDEEVEMGNLE